jgi:SAM-dependent methyltransferase
MNNYEYCAHVAREVAPGGQGNGAFSVLDYGCGAGQIVRALRDSHIEAFGCDVFYQGGDYSGEVPAELLGTVIRRMEGDQIPFAPGSFDLVINNQVLEHVRDLDRVLTEMRRVLKPGGSLLSLFPDRSVWREGHVGIPFLHWFPRGSRARHYYATSLRALGMGKFKKDYGYRAWSAQACDYLDRWTVYRPYPEIRQAYERCFVGFRHVEAEWIDLRLTGSRLAPLGAVLPAAVKRLVARKLAGMVILCRKGEDP